MPRPAPRVASVSAPSPPAVVVRFEDGAVRRYDLSGVPDLPVFRPLQDPTEFERVRVTETRRGIE